MQYFFELHQNLSERKKNVNFAMKNKYKILLNKYG